MIEMVSVSLGKVVLLFHFTPSHSLFNSVTPLLDYRLSFSSEHHLAFITEHRKLHYILQSAAYLSELSEVLEARGSA